MIIEFLIEKVNYVCHSQGTTNIFVLLSEQPDFADKIDRFVCLLGVTFFYKTLKMIRDVVPLSYIFNRM